MHPFEDKEVVIFHVYHLSIKFPGMSRVLHKDLSKVETPIHDSIRKLVTWAWSENLECVSKSERKCWALESELLEV